MATLCGVCREQYKDPRLLPCLHSFCKQCIEKLFKGKTTQENTDIICPSCREKFKVSPQDVENLPHNFCITNLLPILILHSVGEQKGKKVECENCNGQKPAVVRCNDCSVFMCNSCISAHQRIQSLTQNHSVVTLQAVKRAEPRVLAKQLFCLQHEGEPLKMFCESCHVLLCRDCMIFDHQQHEYKKISDVMKRECRAITMAINKAVVMVPILENTLIDVKDMEYRVKKNTMSAEKDVDVFIDAQIRLLQQIRTEMKEGVSTVCEAKLRALKTQEDLVSLHLSNIKYSVQFARQAIRNGSDSEVLSLESQILSRLADLYEKPIVTNPYEDDGISFHTSQDTSLRELMPKLARLISSTAVPSMCSMQVAGGEPGIIYTTFSGQYCEFIVTLRDHFGQQIEKGGNSIQAAITDCPIAQKEAWDASLQFLDVEDNDNGTYDISFMPLYPGRYKIAVAVDRRHVKNSPFTWNVSQKIVNINKFKLDNMFVNRGGMYQGSSTTIDDIVIDGEYCFSWRVRFRSNMFTMSFAGDSSPLRISQSLQSQQSYYQGCKIGVKKFCGSFDNNSLASTSGRSSLSFQSNLRELSKDAWFWCDGVCYSPDDPEGAPSNITSADDGDIFVLFLNPTRRTLIIYNRESKQRDCYEGIECPVTPYLRD